MATVEVHAIRLMSAGYMTCQICHASTMVGAIGKTTDLILWNRGDRNLIETPESRIIHLCGRIVEAWCPSCEGDQAVSLGTGWSKRMICRTCFEEVQWRVVKCP